MWSKAKKVLFPRFFGFVMNSFRNFEIRASPEKKTNRFSLFPFGTTPNCGLSYLSIKRRGGVKLEVTLATCFFPPTTVTRIRKIGAIGTQIVAHRSAVVK